METPDDPRPILYCRRCKTDVVVMPNGACQWCDTQVRRRRKGDPVLVARDRPSAAEMHERRMARYKAA